LNQLTQSPHSRHSAVNLPEESFMILFARII
jgi:hypothetical protein